MWLSTSAFWVGLFTLVVFIPTQLALEKRLTAPEKEVKLLLLLMISGLLSIVFAIDRSAAWLSVVDYFKVVVIFIMIVNVLRTEWRFKVLLLLILSVTVVLSVAAVRDFVTGNLSLQGTRIEGVIGGLFSNPNDLALQFVTMVPIAFVLSFRSRGWSTRILYFLAALSITAGVVATFSRAGFIGLTVVLAVLAWRLAPRRRGLILASLLGLALFIPKLAGYSSRFSTSESSAVARLDDLKRSVNVAIHHALFGVGMNNYRIFSNKELVTHNAYTQVFAEMGVGALFLYVLFILLPLKGLRRLSDASTDKKGNGVRFMAAGLEASIWGYMACSFFASVAYLWYVYYLIAFAISLRRIYGGSGHTFSSPRSAPRRFKPNRIYPSTTYPEPYIEIVSAPRQILKRAQNNKRSKEDLGRSFYRSAVVESPPGRVLNRSRDRVNALTASLYSDVSRHSAFMWTSMILPTAVIWQASFNLILRK
jgi:O-antigen ligase